jgi:ribonuclease P protein component
MGGALGRLQRRTQFLRVAAAKRKWAAPGLVLQVAATEVLPPSSDDVTGQPLLVGFTCSKKVGNAVARNRARRRLRAVAEQVLPVFGVPGHDYVLIGRLETLHRPYALLLQDLQTALKRVGARRDDGDAEPGLQGRVTRREVS